MERFNLVAYQNGRPVGYVKSVNRERAGFSLTMNKGNAKKYGNMDHAMRDIDLCTRYGYEKGYIFSMDC